MFFLNFENQEDRPIEVMIEPSLKRYSIPEKCAFQLEISSVEGLSEFKVDYYADEFLSIWAPVESRILVSGKEPPFTFA